MNHIVEGLKTVFGEIGFVGWLILSIYVSLFGFSLIRGIIRREQRRQIAAERFKMQQQRHRAFLERHAMQRAEHGQRMQRLRAQTSYYSNLNFNVGSRFAARQPSYSNVHAQSGKVYGKWK